jgi:hypothetical protein
LIGIETECGIEKTVAYWEGSAYEIVSLTESLSVPLMASVMESVIECVSGIKTAVTAMAIVWHTNH